MRACQGHPGPLTGAFDGYSCVLTEACQGNPRSPHGAYQGVQGIKGTSQGVQGFSQGHVRDIQGASWGHPEVLTRACHTGNKWPSQEPISDVYESSLGHVRGMQGGTCGPRRGIQGSLGGLVREDEGSFGVFSGVSRGLLGYP